jgi:WD40 repeat protein
MSASTSDELQQFQLRIQGCGHLDGLTIVDFDLSGGIVSHGTSSFTLRARLHDSKASAHPRLANKDLAIRYLFAYHDDARQRQATLAKLSNEIAIIAHVGEHPNIQRLFGWFVSDQVCPLVQQHLERRYHAVLSENDMGNMFSKMTVLVVLEYCDFLLLDNDNMGSRRSFVHQAPDVTTLLPKIFDDVRAAVAHLVSRHVSHLDVREGSVGVLRGPQGVRAVLLNFGTAVRHHDYNMVREWLSDRTGNFFPPEPVGNLAVLPPSATIGLSSGSSSAILLDRPTRFYRDADSYSVVLLERNVCQALRDIDAFAVAAACSGGELEELRGAPSGSRRNSSQALVPTDVELKEAKERCATLEAELRKLRKSSSSALSRGGASSSLASLSVPWFTGRLSEFILHRHDDAMSISIPRSIPLVGHTEEVNMVQYSPDGATIVTVSDDRTIRFWDPASGRELKAFVGHSRTIGSVAFSPCGTKAATGSDDHTARTWIVATGLVLNVFQGHRQPVRSVAFSPDGTLLATGSWDRTAMLWDAETGVVRATLQGHTDFVNCVAFSADGCLLATASWDTTARIWDVAGAVEVVRLAGHKGQVTNVQFHPDGTRVATSSWDRTAKVWGISSGRELLTFAGHQNYIIALCFAPDGHRLATLGSDELVKIWDTTSGCEVMTIVGHRDAICAGCFSPDGRNLVTGSYDKTAIIWELALECTGAAQAQGTPISVPGLQRLLSIITT